MLPHTKLSTLIYPRKGLIMDNQALYALNCGVFLLATKSGDRVNGCITNTCMQVANSPVRVAVSVINSNYTCELIKESGVCTLSVLDESITFETIRHFGMQSGRTVDKMADIYLPEDDRGIPYLGWGACAVLSLKVVDSKDLGSHTLFLAEVTDGKVLNGKKPITYAYYHSDIKPKPAAVQKEKKIVGWRCRICGYLFNGPSLPLDYVCPLCGHDASDFEPVYEA